MPRGQGHQHSSKAKRMAEHVEKSGKRRYSDRATEVAWRVVHSELPKKEREKK